MTWATTSTNNKDPKPPVVHIYPHNTPLHELERNNYRHIKHMHFIRHAQGTHNVHQEYRKMEHLDARLTEKGKEQCRALAATIEAERPYLFDAELIVTSPLTRCIQTTLLSLDPILQKNRHLPVLANEWVRETVNYNCDRRRTITEIASEHPRVNFEHVEHDHDPIWEAYEQRLGGEYPAHRESAELHRVADRGRRFFAWLAQREERHVVVCSHAAYLRCLWNFGHAEQVPFQPPQDLDDRLHACRKNNVPVVHYMDSDHAEQLQQTFDNCELRSMIVAFA